MSVVKIVEKRANIISDTKEFITFQEVESSGLYLRNGLITQYFCGIFIPCDYICTRPILNRKFITIFSCLHVGYHSKWNRMEVF